MQWECCAPIHCNTRTRQCTQICTRALLRCLQFVALHTGVETRPNFAGGVCFCMSGIFLYWYSPNNLVSHAACHVQYPKCSLTFPKYGRFWESDTHCPEKLSALHVTTVVGVLQSFCWDNVMRRKRTEGWCRSSACGPTR